MTTAVSYGLATSIGAPASVSTGQPEVMSYLASFPVELLTRILGHMCARERVRFSQVCHRFRQVFYTQPAGEYAVELELNNLRNGPTQTFCTSERLQRLREYREAWKTLHWKTETTLNLTENTNIRVHGSVLGRCEADTESIRFDFLQVPSVCRNIPRRDWAVDVPVRAFDFEFDTLQNLLVVMERIMPSHQDAVGFLRLHFRTLDTGAQHPFASASSIDFRPQHPLTPEWYLHQSTICDEHICIMLADEVDDGQVELWVLDWKTGKFTMNLYSAYHNKAEGCAFLQSGKLLLPMVVPAEDTLQGTLGFLAIFDCRKPLPDRIRFALALAQYSVAMFRLPEPAVGNYYARILMGGSGCSSQPAYPNPYPHLDNDVPFFADTRTRVFVFDMTVFDFATHGVMGHTFLVPSSALELRARVAEESGRKLYHPNSWIRDTRLTLSVLLQSHTTVFQRRCIAPEFPYEDSDCRVVALYETNHTLSMRKELAHAPHRSAEYFLEPYEDADTHTWLEPVHTKMPYRRVVTNIDAGKTSDLHIAEDCFIIRCQETHECRIFSF